jgi:hypothetical protein
MHFGNFTDIKGIPQGFSEPENWNRLQNKTGVAP